MKKVTAFYLEGCPYCRQSRKALKALTKENGNYSTVNIDWIEETQHPEISEQYDYYHVPSMFIDGKKLYEAHPGESYDECMNHVKSVLDEALA